MKAIDFLIKLSSMGCRPCFDDKGRPDPGTNQLKRWLDSGAVTINGIRPKSVDYLEFPITELVFFSKNNKKRITMC